MVEETNLGEPSMTQPLKRAKLESSSKGFTVMEILVVLAVVGILSSIGFVTLTSMRPRLALKGVVSEMSTMFHKARLDAIRRNQVVIGTLETTLGADTNLHNPLGIDDEFVVFKSQTTMGAATELNSYRLFRGFPSIHLWGHTDSVINGAGAITFKDDKLVFNVDGTVVNTGAFRFAYRKTGMRNTLEVAVDTKAGIPEVRKFLVAGDRPSGAPAQEFFIETMASSGGSRALWVWY